MKIIDIPQSMLDMLAFRLNGGESWNPPLPLSTTLPPVAPFDRKLLPDVLADFVLDEAYRMQAPPDFVAVACITMLGSVIGTGCTIRPKQADSWTVVANIWGGVVGSPGRMKSPAIDAGMAPIHWLESDASQEHKLAMAGYLERKTIRELEIKQLKSGKVGEGTESKAEEIRSRLQHLLRADNHDQEPKCRRYRTNDATVEKLAELAVDSPRGLLYVRDELAGLFANCSKPGREGDRAFFLEAWNGLSSHAVDRIGRGYIVVPRLCLSLFGGIQPERLQEYLIGTLNGYDNDGLFQRFQLMVYPDDIGDWKYVDQQPNDGARAKVIDIVRKLAVTDFVSLGANAGGDGQLPYFRFSANAQPLFVRWLTGLEDDVRRIEKPILAEHIGKYRKMVPALALIFHLVDLAAGKKFRTPGVSKDALVRAIAWHGYLETHARRIYSMALDVVQPAANALASRINSSALADGFSERDVYKKGWANLTDPQVVQAACRELELDHWIRRIPPERGTGRPGSPTYNINPALKT